MGAEREVVKNAVYLRGSIIHSYAHIEHLLADVCLQAWKTKQYARLAGTFPYKTESRIKAVRTLIEADGPLKGYGSDLRPVLDDLLNFEELRHFVAHGVMVVRPDSADVTLEFRLFRTTKAGTEIGSMTMSSAQLEELGVKISALLQQLLTTLHRIYPHLGFQMESWDRFTKRVIGDVIEIGRRLTEAKKIDGRPNVGGGDVLDDGLSQLVPMRAAHYKRGMSAELRKRPNCCAAAN